MKLMWEKSLAKEVYVVSNDGVFRSEMSNYLFSRSEWIVEERGGETKRQRAT